MIKNIIKTAWRNVVRHKTNSLINVTGLALGITCCLFIFLWVQDEQSVDNFHKKEKNLYVVYQTLTTQGKPDGSYNTPVKNINNVPVFLMEDAKEAIPQVRNLSFYVTGYELPWGHPETFQVGDKTVKLEGSRASADFFKMFSYPLLEGSPESALADISSMAISRKMADIFFGGPAAAMGKTLRYENKLNFVVKAVFEDIPAQSSLKFDFLLNWEAQKKLLERSSNNFQTYIELADRASAEQTENAINRYLLPRITPVKGTEVHIGLQALAEKYLHSNFQNGRPSGGRIEYVRLFSGVALFILVIACINFMNLTTARAARRAKEVGVRKVAGSTRWQLMLQFFGESLIFALLAMGVSLILLWGLLPAFSRFTSKQFSFPLVNLPFWSALLGLTVLTGILAGSYPSLYLSSLQPVKIIKGKLRFTPGAVLFRKTLTVFQFVLSIILLIATLVITRQTGFVEHVNLGYDRDNLVYFRIEGELAKKERYLLFKNEVSRLPGILQVDRTTEVPHTMNFVVGGDVVSWEGKEPNAQISIKPASVGFDFVKTMKMEIVSGRDFSRAVAADSTDAFLVNEQAVREMGLRNPVGKWVSAWSKRGHIIGVLKDFHTQSLREPVKPVLLDIKEGESFGAVLVRIDPSKMQTALESLAKVYKDINPAYPFSSQFIDQEYQKLYENEQVTSRLSVVFAIVAILISSLGLLGLVMFSAEQRVKEFGVRKVLGASLPELMSLFAKEFLKLVLIAFVIAVPIGWMMMHNWLQAFAYRVPLSWWIFLLAGATTALITLITLAYEAFKTATASPIKSLRSE